MLRKYRKHIIIVLLCVIIWAYYYHFLYVLHLSGIYSTNAQVKDVSVEFNGAWLPAASNESPFWFFLKEKNTIPTIVLFKIESLKPRIQGKIGILWIGDRYDGFSQSRNIYSETLHFDWGTANILKKEFTADPTLVFVVVPEFKILISADNLDQLKDIKTIKKLNGVLSALSANQSPQNQQINRVRLD